MRALMIGGVSVIALAAAAYGGWTYGATQLGDQIDAELQRYAADGVEVTYGSREIGGFPFGYAVTHKDVVLQMDGGGEQGADGRIEFPTLESSAPLFGGEIATRMPETARLLVDMPGQEPLALDMLSTDAVQYSARDGKSGRFEVGRLALKLADDNAHPFFKNLSVAYENGSGVYEHVGDDLMNLDFAADAFSYGLEVDVPEMDGQPATAMRTDVALRDFDMRVEGFPVQKPERLTEEGAAAVLTLHYSGSTMSGSQEFAPGMPNFVYSGEAGAGDVRASVEDRSFALSSSAADTIVRYDLAALGLPELVLAAPVANVAMRFPLDFQAEDAPFSFSMKIDEMMANDAFLDHIDAQKLLPRVPSRIDIALNGEMTLAGFNPAMQQPPEGKLVVERFDLGLFGAAASVSGEVAPSAAGADAPAGHIVATLRDWTPLLDFAVAMGVAEPQMKLMAEAMAPQYADPEAGGDALRAEIRMENGKIFVNGQRVQ